TGKVRKGYHTYPLTVRSPQQLEEQLSTLAYEDSPGLQPLWPVSESEPGFETIDGKLLAEHKGTFTWSQDVLVKPDATPGPTTLRFRINLQVCDDNGCFPGEFTFQEPVVVSDAPAVPLTPEVQARLKSGPPPVRVVTPGGSGSPTVTATASPGSDLWAFILAGVFWGAVSLITPCVFPMIPITVSFFLKQSESQHHRPLTLAAVYCATIVVVLTISAVALLSVFRALSTNPVMNFVIGGLFVFFALSLFGMYEIELPSGLARFTSEREGRG